jgi:hypothetical protein
MKVRSVYKVFGDQKGRDIGAYGKIILKWK